MLLPIELLGFVLAAAVGISGPTGARLNNTGEVRAVSKALPAPMLLLTLLYGISGLAAIFYFSWAHLNWVQIVSFFVVWFVVGDRLAKASSRSLVWSAFVLSVLLAVLAQVLLILGSGQSV